MTGEAEKLKLKPQTLKFFLEQMNKENKSLNKQVKALQIQSPKLAKVIQILLESVVSIYIIDWQTQKLIASGSGFFVDADAIITNFQTVAKVATANTTYEEDAGALVLVKSEEEELRIAQVVFTGNAELDLAVLLATDYIIDLDTGEEIEDSDPLYPVMEFSDEVEIGEKVIALGNPIDGQSPSISRGIIEEIIYDAKTIDKIDLITFKTNAEITATNTGGPLINLQGETLGITSYQDSNTVLGSQVIEQFLDKFEANFEID